MSEEINPWKALRFACDGLERICMGTADEADSSSIAEKALFAAIGHMGVSDIAARELAARAGEDAPGSEPQPAKVIVVRDENGREHRYAAPNFGMLHDGTLVIGDKRDSGELRVDAAHAPGRWASACKDDVAAPDSTATALGIAKLALERIAATDGSVVDTAALWKIAQDAAEEIFTETEL